jgi:hypothetical protein
MSGAQIRASIIFYTRIHQADLTFEKDLGFRHPDTNELIKRIPVKYSPALSLVSRTEDDLEQDKRENVEIHFNIEEGTLRKYLEQYQKHLSRREEYQDARKAIDEALRRG